MQGVVPIMFEMVAVARTLELRMPCLAIFSRTTDQSIFPPQVRWPESLRGWGDRRRSIRA